MLRVMKVKVQDGDRPLQHHIIQDQRQAVHILVLRRPLRHRAVRAVPLQPIVVQTGAHQRVLQAATLTVRLAVPQLAVKEAAVTEVHLAVLQAVMQAVPLAAQPAVVAEAVPLAVQRVAVISRALWQAPSGAVKTAVRGTRAARRGVLRGVLLAAVRGAAQAVQGPAVQGAAHPAVLQAVREGGALPMALLLVVKRAAERAVGLAVLHAVVKVLPPAVDHLPQGKTVVMRKLKRWKGDTAAMKKARRENAMQVAATPAAMLCARKSDVL